MPLEDMTSEEFVKAVARETARMSWPGRMSGILKAGTKKKVEGFFVIRADNPEWMKMWTDPHLCGRFGKWHKGRTHELAEFLTDRDLVKNMHIYKPEAVAAKILNTYLHQLMKYEPPRRCYHVLHLPLDQKIREALRAELSGTRHDDALELLRENSPYTLSYEQYACIQAALREYCTESGGLAGIHPQWSRIELNLLWAAR